MQHLSGHLELTCSADDHARSYIRRQSFRAPFHLSKPYWDGHALIAQIANPTAGLFAGDTLRSEVTVDPGARLLLTTTSASRVHTMPAGRAEVHQTYHVASGAWLEVRPELFIPQAECRTAKPLVSQWLLAEASSLWKRSRRVGSPAAKFSNLPNSIGRPTFFSETD